MLHVWRIFVRRIRREEYLLGVAKTPDVLPSLSAYKDYYIHRSTSGMNAERKGIYGTTGRC